MLEHLVRANDAYDKIVSLGPFYGKDLKGETPSFRVSAEPVMLPQHLKNTYTQLGQDTYLLAQTLPLLPDPYISLIGGGWSPQIPFLWRLDTIIDDGDNVYVNEIQISDGADGRMIGLQLAYGLTTLDQSTAGHIVEYIAGRYRNNDLIPPKIAFIRHDLFNSPYASNAKRMHEFLIATSNGKIDFALMDRRQLDETGWEQFQGVINYAFIREGDLFARGVTRDQLLCVGDACYIGSKAVFALLNDQDLESFWLNHLDPDVFQRIKKRFIHSTIVKGANDITSTKNNGAVIKIYDTERLSVLGASRGVFGPWDLTDEGWRLAYSSLDNGSRLIVQDFVRPKRFPLLLRKNRGRDLEQVKWYNKIAAKYVVLPDEKTVALTGLEATLGSSEKPAGKGCCITTVDFY